MHQRQQRSSKCSASLFWHGFVPHRRGTVNGGSDVTTHFTSATYCRQIQHWPTPHLILPRRWPLASAVASVGVTSFGNELRQPLPQPCTTTTTDGASRTCKQVKPPINLNRQLRALRLVGKKEKLRDVWEGRGWRSASPLHVSSQHRHSLRQWKIERAVYLCAPNGGEPDG